MTDDGYTWRDHIGRARMDLDEADAIDNLTVGTPESIRQMLFLARASLTRAIALLPAPKDDE